MINIYIDDLDIANNFLNKTLTKGTSSSRDGQW